MAIMTVKAPLVALALATLTFASSAATAEEVGSPTQARVYVVSPGDTLGSIALRFNVALADVRGWNGLRKDDVHPGDRLVVARDGAAQDRAPLPIVHLVREGDTLERIARRYGVATEKVLKWNTNLDPRRLLVGQQVRLHIEGREGHSISWGSANRGKLINPLMLTSSPGLRVRNDDRAFGTRRTVQMLEAAAADIKARWPDAPDLLVGDLSASRGGRLRPHRSHQSGRDADISYYHRGNVPTTRFLHMTAETFDAAKNWHMFKTLIDTGQVQFIFVEYALQKQLYDYALSIGFLPDDLKPVLQYPHGRESKWAVIRHARGHADHFHIRFTCGPRDTRCE